MPMTMDLFCQVSKPPIKAEDIYDPFKKKNAKKRAWSGTRSGVSEPRIWLEVHGGIS